MAIEIPEEGLAADASPLEAQAFRLWRFVQRHVPRFSREQALIVLRELNPSDSDEIKPFAARLRLALKTHRAILTHSAALQASARVLRDMDWYHARQGELLHTLLLSEFNEGPDEPLADWQRAGSRLASICENWVATHLGMRAFEIKATPNSLVLSALEIDSHEAPGDWQTMPIAVVNAAEPNVQWLKGVGIAVELLRRRLEEQDIAVVDGFQVLRFCDCQEKPWVSFWAVEARDAPNAELVLMRQDNRLMSASGFEITRGDEIACFTQLDLAMEGQTGEITVDDNGGWVCGDARYVWQIVALQAKGFSPGVNIMQLGSSSASQLLRRYRIVKKILGRQLPYRRGRKHLDYLGGPDESYRLDANRLQLALKRSDLTWEDYCADVGEPGMGMAAEMPIEFVFPLISRLLPEDPNSLLARPRRGELSRADDDSILRALLPRVNHVRYRVAQDIARDAQTKIKEAIEQLSASILMRSGSLRTEDPLPDLVYGGDGDELLAILDELGLVAYVGVMPYFKKLTELKETSQGVYPYAFGHSLYLEIVEKDS